MNLHKIAVGVYGRSPRLVGSDQSAGRLDVTLTVLEEVPYFRDVAFGILDVNGAVAAGMFDGSSIRDLLVIEVLA